MLLYRMASQFQLLRLLKPKDPERYAAITFALFVLDIAVFYELLTNGFYLWMLPGDASKFFWGLPFLSGVLIWAVVYYLDKVSTTKVKVLKIATTVLAVIFTLAIILATWAILSWDY